MTASDLGDLNKAVQEALEIKKNRYAYKHNDCNQPVGKVFQMKLHKFALPYCASILYP